MQLAFPTAFSVLYSTADSLKAAIRAHLVADAGVSAIADGRVYHRTLPQGATLPAVLYARTTEPRDYHDAGSFALREAHVQITCWAETADTADQLADAVITALDAYSGAMGGITVQWIACDDRGDLDHIPADAQEHTRHGARCEFTVWYHT